MPVLALIQFFPPGSACLSERTADSVLSAPSLAFNPVKLVCLVIWFYLCLYFVQRVEFSPLVPKQYKSIANVVTLFTGPILLLALLIADTVKKTSEDKGTFFEIIKHQIRNVFSNIRRTESGSDEDISTIKLLDTSGRSIDEIYGHGNGKRPDSRILNLTERVIADALDQRASDILIDPKDEAIYTIRLRIDGVLRIVKELEAETCRAVVNSIKAISSMDISERRRPQDGAFIAKRGKRTASFRVASAGVLNGEKVALRILNQNAGTFKLTDVGLTEKQLSVIESVIKKPSGMVLICGPTGSGKTTTMYAMLNQIDRFTRNVITIEDPVEAFLPQASQIEINPKADITFAKTLRSVLRQDPDVICVGEIRDEESAEIALRASQTGHLVLATLHCDSNTAALIRLLDLGVSSLLLASGLSLLVSQRLLRVLCEHCKKPAELTQSLTEEFEKRGIEYGNMFQAEGCRRCGGTGYFGRIAVCDPLLITDQLKADIANNKTLITELKTDGTRKDRFNMRKEGLRQVASGITTLEELKRMVG
ncbi:MAG: GspE/PulE family protein [Planctomycetota bacterium]|nr:GspE/PulE family protein [Planctomycetota bacterium]